MPASSRCRTLLVFLILVGFHSALQAQPLSGRPVLDSLLRQSAHFTRDTNGVKEMDALATAYRSIAPDSGLLWAEKEQALADHIGWRKGQAMALNQTGVNTQNKSRHAPALEIYFKALRIYEELGDRHGIAEVQGNIGNVYFRQRDWEKALLYLGTSLQLANALGDKLIAQAALGCISGTYLRQGRQDTALRCQLNALQLAIETGDPRAIMLQNSNTGTAYASGDQYRLALAYYFKSLRMAEDLGDRQRMAIALGNIGGGYYDAAADTTGPPRADSLVAGTHAANYALCISYLRRAVVACREAQVYDYISAISETLSDALAATGDYKGALEAYKQFKTVNDSLHNNTITEKIAAIETQRALALKEKDVQLAKLAVAKKRNERRLFIVIIGLLAVLFAGAFAYTLQRARHRRRRAEEAIRRRIAQDLHDDIGSTLSAITIYSSVAEQSATPQPQLLRKISESSGKVMETMSDIVWNMAHSDDGFEAFINRMREHAAGLFEAQQTTLHFDADDDLLKLKGVRPEHRKDFYLIYKEALNNSIKYAGAANVWVCLQQEGGRLLLSIRDDGRGFDMAAARRDGNGLKNMAARATAIGAALTLRSMPGTGTELMIRY